MLISYPEVGDAGAGFVDDAGMMRWLNLLGQNKHVEIRNIGKSREGRDLYGMQVGKGPSVQTITAGAHADEPAGPLTAMLLLLALSGNSDEAEQMRHKSTWLICPQVNPDGAERNRAWFQAVPDLRTYLTHVRRELPGDDVEFGYPGDGLDALRPENQAVANFFGAANAADFHGSLHSMAFAEGAWYLLGGSAVAQAELRKRLARIALRHELGLHDIERQGDKGFHRIAKGFCTTPNSRAMAQHFRDRGDEAMAARFRLSSMEWTLARNGSARLLVTEIPVFTMGDGPTKGFVQHEAHDGPTEVNVDVGGPGPDPGETAYEKFRGELQLAMAKRDVEAAVETAKRYGARAVPFDVQCRVMFEAVVTVAVAGIDGGRSFSV